MLRTHSTARAVLILGTLFPLFLSTTESFSDVIVLRPERDTTLYENLPGTSNALGDHFFAGTSNRGENRRSLVSFNVPGNVPPDATINSVSLKLTVSRSGGGVGGTASLHRSLGEWDEGLSRAFGEEGGGGIATEGDATWFDRVYPDVLWSTVGGDFVAGSSASTTVGGTGDYIWDSSGMRSDVEFWLSNPSNNFGWFLRGNEGVTGSARRYDSRSNGTPSRRPSLTIDYTPSGATVGACCLPGEVCILLNSSQCNAQLGSYQGNNTTCSANPCNGVPIDIVFEASSDNTLYEDPTGQLSNGAGEFLYTAMNAGLETRRALVKFDLAASLPLGSIIASAKLTMRKIPGGGIAHDVTLHRMLDSWGEGASDAPGDEVDGTAATSGDATWIHRFYPDVFWSSPGGDFDPLESASTYIPAFESFNEWEEPGMVQDLQAWIDDPASNHGWLVLGQETGSVITEKGYVSREGTPFSYRPKLSVTYSVPEIPPPTGLPGVPVPAENPITEEKRVLGKILFWEEQLGSDNTVACGTCHRAEGGGADLRVGRHPGADLIFNTDDDVLGSPGVRRADAAGTYIPDSVFGDDVQVTGRVSPSFFGSLWSREQFWDGRAGEVFRDPLTDDIVIPTRASLESQALGPILSDVEMAREDRTWADVVGKLSTAVPLALAEDIPSDVLDALVSSPTYPALFADAFNDGAITPTRIAMAIATYERTLVADETAYDHYIAGDNGALTADQLAGADFILNGPCAACHGGPVFTTNTYRNIGLRPPAEDIGRQEVTGDPNDFGRFKVPSLRNVSLRNRLMHTGQITDVGDAIDFYSLNGHTHFTENQDENIEGGIDILPSEKLQIMDFLANGLTDPRVAAGTFPFDRPTLASESTTSVDWPPSPGSSSSVPTFLDAGAFPNPFTNEVSISFTLSGASDVDVSIFSAGGQLVAKKFVEADAGVGRFAWNGRNAHGSRVPSGVYFVRFAAGSETATGRLVRVE